jgi:radical SAM protein with 4Fe4S-binding SPASM domain
MFRRHPAVRLRRERWGGLAFHRDIGELLELDSQGFQILASLSSAATLRELAVTVRSGVSRLPRLPELARFLLELDERGFIERVPPDIHDGLHSTSYESTAAILPDQPASAVTSKRELSAPLVAHWAVTFRCNLACAFCYSESHPRREHEPAAHIRARIVERLAAWGIFEVALGGGEPTILSDFSQLLAAIRRHGMVPNVTTNGVSCSDTMLSALAEHAGTVHLSADRSELLDAARGAGVSARIKNTARRLSTFNIRWGVNLLLSPDNVQSLHQSLVAMEALGATAITLLRPKGAWTTRNWPGFPSPRDMSLIAAGVNRFIKRAPALRLFVDTALRSEWSQAGLLGDPEPEVVGCGGGQRHVAITPAGDVYPCSHARGINLRMGNLMRDDFDQIWQGARGQAARRRFKKQCHGATCACSGPQSMIIA